MLNQFSAIGVKYSKVSNIIEDKNKTPTSPVTQQLDVVNLCVKAQNNLRNKNLISLATAIETRAGVTFLIKKKKLRVAVWAKGCVVIDRCCRTCCVL